MTSISLSDDVYPIYNIKKNKTSTVNFDITEYVNKNDLSTQTFNGHLSSPSITTQVIKFNGSTQNIAYTDEDKINLDKLVIETPLDTIKLTDIDYNDTLLTTTIKNNCYVENITCGNINTLHLNETTGNLQTQITNIFASANAITYDSITKTTTIADNLIADNLVSAITTSLQLQITNILNSLVPTGSILIHASNGIPDGFMLCDGTAKPKSQYQNLWNVIGNTYLYGKSANAQLFYVPDLRGMFIRGAGENVFVSRLVNGLSTGTYQEQSIEQHVHTYTIPNASKTVLDNVSATGKSHETVWGDSLNGTFNTVKNVTIDDETRPHNISMNYIIKY